MSASQYMSLKQNSCESVSPIIANIWAEQSERLSSELSSLARVWKIIYTLFVLLCVSITTSLVLYSQLESIRNQLDTQSYG
jgi:hypothetical protein